MEENQFSCARAGASRAEEDAAVRRPYVELMAYISSYNEGLDPPFRPTPLPPSNGATISFVGQIFMAAVNACNRKISVNCHPLSQ